MKKIVSIGWKNYEEGQQKYVIVRPEHRAGMRNVVLPNDATYNDVLNKCEEIFFSDGTSYFGDIVHFSVTLMSFKATATDDSFILENYIKEDNLSKTRIYFYSKKASKKIQTYRQYER